MIFLFEQFAYSEKFLQSVLPLETKGGNWDLPKGFVTKSKSGDFVLDGVDLGLSAILSSRRQHGQLLLLHFPRLPGCFLLSFIILCQRLEGKRRGCSMEEKRSGGVWGHSLTHHLCLPGCQLPNHSLVIGTFLGIWCPSPCPLRGSTVLLM